VLQPATGLNKNALSLKIYDTDFYGTVNDKNLLAEITLPKKNSDHPRINTKDNSLKESEVLRTL